MAMPEMRKGSVMPAYVLRNPRDWMFRKFEMIVTSPGINIVVMITAKRNFLKGMSKKENAYALKLARRTWEQMTMQQHTRLFFKYRRTGTYLNTQR